MSISPFLTWHTWLTRIEQQRWDADVWDEALRTEVPDAGNQHVLGAACCLLLHTAWHGTCVWNMISAIFSLSHASTEPHDTAVALTRLYIHAADVLHHMSSHDTIPSHPHMYVVTKRAYTL